MERFTAKSQTFKLPVSFYGFTVHVVKMQFRKIIANYIILSGIIFNCFYFITVFVDLRHALVTHLVIVHYCVINVVKMGLVGDHYTCKCASSESTLDK
jgi:hypothetical protein